MNAVKDKNRFLRERPFADPGSPEAIGRRSK